MGRARTEVLKFLAGLVVIGGRAAPATRRS